MKLLKLTASAAVAALAICLPQNALGWSQKGHDTTAYIAEQHFTPTTEAAVAELLDGMSPVYWANWLDNASHTADYAYTKTWHYINVDEGQTYETAPKNPKGDVVTATREMIEILSDPGNSREDRQLALKILIHIVGDMHQPMHAGHASDSGGNGVNVSFFGSSKNLHSIWDGSIAESGHKWSYTEWQQQIDRATPAEEAVIISGNIDDWAKQSLAIAADIYKYFPAGKSVSYNEVADWTPTIEEQFLKGGLRLAHILNLLFDPEYASGGTITSATDL